MAHEFLDPAFLEGLTVEDMRTLIDELPPAAVAQLLSLSEGTQTSIQSPLQQAYEIDEGYRERQHLVYMSERIARAVKDVEQGRSRRLVISMPPRSGKSYLTTQIAPLWMLQRHPEWSIALTSHDSSLAAQWGRQVRRWIESGKVLGVEIASDAGAVKEWETTAGGGVLSRSIRESFTGRGAKVLLIDDPHKDFVDAHSSTARQAVWDWWLSVAQTRLEPPSLVVVIQTRWHEDDLVGRLLSTEYDGDPSEWEVITLPALAEEGDALGRDEGEPLLSPLFEESVSDALDRWESVKKSVGSYVWSALYQQRPAPARGSVFDMGTFRFWTSDPARATEDGRVVYVDPEALAARGEWLDSWDFTFKGEKTSDFVVGQRWARMGANRYLVAQQRGRWNFVESLKAIERWGQSEEALADAEANPFGARVHKRLVEDAANGPAIISALKEKVSGLKPIKARVSKEARARAVSPEIESGNVLLPDPGEPGNEWVSDLLSELRVFPHDKHDDQVDAMTQALTELRGATGSVTNPNDRKPKASAITQRRIDRPTTAQRVTSRRIIR